MKPLEKTIAACLLSGIVAIWFAYPHVLLWLFSPSATLVKLGPFGDLYGGLNTLFSGLALFGLGVNIYMQGVQIKKLEEKEQQNEDQLQKQARALRATALLNYYNASIADLKSRLKESRTTINNNRTENILRLTAEIETAKRRMDELVIELESL